MAALLPRVSPGDGISADAHNALVDAVNSLLGLSADFPLVVQRTAAGVRLRLARQPSLKFVALAEDMAAGETDKTAHVLDYKASAEEWVDTTADGAFSSQTTGQLTDPQDGGVYFADERHLVYFDPESGKRIPIASPGPHLAVAEATIAHGSSGTVTLHYVSGGSETASTLEVTAHNWLLPKIWEGAPLLVQFHLQSRRWYVTRAYSATLLLATVNEAGGVAESDTTFDVDGVTPLDGHFGESTIASVRNTFGHILDDDATVALVWNDADDAWETWQGHCPA